MVFVQNRHILVAAAFSLLYCVLPTINANVIATAASPAPAGHSNPETCEFRTINYITTYLPQQCLRSAWSGANSVYTKTDAREDAITTSQATDGPTGTSSGITNQELVTKTMENDTHKQESSPPSDPTLSASISILSPTETNLSPSVDADGGELNDAAFLSFEEWKKQTLEKAGQANENIGNTRAAGPRQKKRDPESMQSSLDSLGDEGEIDLDFGAFQGGDGNEEAAPLPHASEPESQQDFQTQDVPQKHKEIYRSKDAGKTYKERFSYASFDGGATVLKTHPGAKNAKAVLVENKDSYMLSECAAENKFLIIELSEDIWIDTLVLANYEFFSSMIRTFRVSVSDRYSVKVEKWKYLGTYEARNSREIQAFLIENPQIWARYIRIEFISHYGNEYYCPLSLVRVHGTRMLESWKETEATGDEDDSEESDEQGTEEHFVPDAVALVVQEEEKLNAELKQAQATIHSLTKTSESTTSEQAGPTLNSTFRTNFDSYANASLDAMTDPWIKQDTLFHILDQLYSSSQASIICHIADAPTGLPDSQVIRTLGLGEGSTPETKNLVTAIASATASDASPLSPPSGRNITDPATLENSVQPQTSPVTIQTLNSTSSSQVPNATVTASSTSRSQNVTSSQKNKTATSTSSGASSLPTIQESFFNAVSRRLQLLEANSTLSLKYIEEQSKILREAFTKVEKKQLQKTDTFLDTLNSTVLEELRGFRQQYDEIWQSTVISLESQREESRREILAVSTRLNILADEVVFQKRMSIVQSVLLLLCLGLIIFSRVSASGSPDFPSMQARTRNSVFHATPGDSPLESPSLQRADSIGNQGEWLDPQDGRHRTEEYPMSNPRSREDSLPTPVSSYSRSDNALTPPSGGDDSLVDPASNPISSTSEYLDPSTQPNQSVTTNPLSTVWHGSSDNGESNYLSPSSAGMLRGVDRYVKQQFSPPASGMHHDVIYGLQTSLEHRSWIGEDIRSENSSPCLPSPPAERRSEETEQYISRKPLPALPQHDS